MDTKTMRDVPLAGAEAAEQIPGLVLVFGAEKEAWGVIPLPSDAPALDVGRGEVAGVALLDAKISRKHARVERQGARWIVTDHDSTNGTFVDGTLVKGERSFDHARVMRLGGSVFLLSANVRPFLQVRTRNVGGLVLGATISTAHAAIRRAAMLEEHVFLTGATGAGKEVAAKVFHESGPHAKGPFVAVNCAAIPQGLAERLLFGAKKGSYSGADADADGYLQAADGGTLFLDEIAELETQVQAKLLRTLETREVTPLGATKPRAVSLRVCSATHVDLRARVADGRFREDLYFRIARPEVRIPSLRERPEEIAAYISAQLDRIGPVEPKLLADATLIEACLLRAWPGNVRELTAEVRRAALAVASEFRALVIASDLDERAGIEMTVQRREGGTPARGVTFPDDEVAAALREERGNVSRAAARLGIHRNRVRRWLERHDVDRSSFADGAPIDDDAD